MSECRWCGNEAETTYSLGYDWNFCVWVVTVIGVCNVCLEMHWRGQ